MDEALVNRIVERVVTALGGPGASSDRIAPRQADRTQQQTGTMKVFVTADMFTRRMAASHNGGAIELAENEFLTPSAAELAEIKHIVVKKTPKQMPQAAPSPDQPQAIPKKNSIGLVIERPGDKVAGVINALRYDGIELAGFNETDRWIRNLRSLCEAVAAGRHTAGVALLPYAADAMILANKIDGIRAVQATRPASVAAALRHFGANMLIVEHVFCTYHEMRAMIRTFAAGAGQPGGGDLLLETVAELEGS